MASRFPSPGPVSGSSEDSEVEDEWWESPDKLSLSHSELDSEDLELRLAHHIQTAGPGTLTSLAAAHNTISQLPDTLALYSRLTRLDLAHNRLTSLPASLGQLSGLTHLLLTSNLLTEADLPKSLGRLSSLRSLNLSGNQLEAIPPQLLELTSLRSLYLGANTITECPAQIARLRRLKILYLGGNLLSSVPGELGQLPYLQSLSLSHNQLRRLPDSLASLSRLRVLHLHHNLLTTLPAGLVTITSLQDLSLRDNPLVMRFIRDMELQPASLLELSARCVKLHGVPYEEAGVPGSLLQYLATACQCVNPDCDGVYFNHRVEHVKFSDFCGKYRVPLLQYLCSAHCSVSMQDSGQEQDRGQLPLSRVLLG